MSKTAQPKASFADSEIFSGAAPYGYDPPYRHPPLRAPFLRTLIVV